jgi:hypothetical protein
MFALALTGFALVNLVFPSQLYFFSFTILPYKLPVIIPFYNKDMGASRAKFTGIFLASCFFAPKQNPHLPLTKTVARFLLPKKVLE